MKTNALTLALFKRLTLLTIVLSMAYGCMAVTNTGKTLKPSDFKGEISRIKADKRHSIFNSKASRHYRLAMLYSHQNNPNPDFRAAARKFNAYLKLKPNDTLSDEVKYKLGLIEKLIKARDESKKNEETIKKLKDLDMTIEQRRRNIL